jgi:glycosyltransferase involved in cell wall biosynthesis
MDKNTIEFVYTGRVSKEKEIEKTIDFLKEVENSGKSFVLNIYGPRSNYFDQVLKYFKSRKFVNGHLRYHGILSRENLLIEIKKYDIYVQTSPNEGMAISVLDAMSVGMVCLVVPSGEIRRYGEHLQNLIKFNDDNSINLKNLNVLKDLAVIERISKNAHISCQQKIRYDEAFAKAILNN